MWSQAKRKEQRAPVSGLKTGIGGLAMALKEL
jgi:hypothetical protein